MAVRSILWLHRVLIELRDTPAARDPLEQTYLVVRNVGEYFLLPIDHNVEIQKSSTEESITPEIKMKTEVIDNISEESSGESQHETIKRCTNQLDQIPPEWPRQMPLQLFEFLEKYPNSNKFEQCPTTNKFDQCPTTNKFEQCPTPSITSIDYSNGERTRTKRVFKCSQCKWRFRNWRILHKHMQRHLLSYKCDICGAIFKYKASFLKHKEAHKDDD